MNKAKIVATVSRKLHKAGFKIKKHSPEILAVVGTVGVVASAVLACKATTRVSEIMDEAKDTIDVIQGGIETGEIEGHEYPAEVGKKDMTITYVQTGVKLVKLYAPSVALGVVSLGCILGSNHILRKRNVALAAAYATVDRSFKQYRNRVIERFGEGLDRELRYNIRAKEIQETVVHEDGTETVVNKTIEVIDPNEYSEFARFFDDGCKGWEKDAEHNLFFLRQQQALANKILQTNHILFLNDVYEMLGIPKTAAGQVVGWVYDENNPDADCFVDFGIYELHNERKRAFVNGYERVILLDFNVTGNILKYI